MKKIHKNILIIIAIAYGIVILVFLLLPEDNPIVPKGNADEHYVQGILHFQKGQYDPAISEFTKSLKIKPSFTEGYRYRGLAYVKKGELDEAILNFTKAIEKYPRSVLDHIHRGNAYRTKGEYDLAMSDYNKAIEIRPRSFDAYNERALLYKVKGEYDLATIDLNKAIELEAESHFRSGKSMYERAKSNGRIREYNMAISYYTKAIELNPKCFEAYVNRGLVYLQKQEYDKAWGDVYKAKDLGAKVEADFIKELREASGREE